MVLSGSLIFKGEFKFNYVGFWERTFLYNSSRSFRACSFHFTLFPFFFFFFFIIIIGASAHSSVFSKSYNPLFYIHLAYPLFLFPQWVRHLPDKSRVCPCSHTATEKIDQDLVSLERHTTACHHLFVLWVHTPVTY